MDRNWKRCVITQPGAGDFSDFFAIEATLVQTVSTRTVSGTHVWKLDLSQNGNFSRVALATRDFRMLPPTAMVPRNDSKE